MFESDHSAGIGRDCGGVMGRVLFACTLCAKQYERQIMFLEL